KAEELNSQYSDRRLQQMSDEELMKLYAGDNQRSDSDIEARGIGWQNKYAYAKIINRVSMEIAQRSALEQAALIRKQNPDAIYDPNGPSKDLSPIQSWLMASNIPSDHPDLQAAVRKIKQ